MINWENPLDSPAVDFSSYLGRTPTSVGHLLKTSFHLFRRLSDAFQQFNSEATKWGQPQSSRPDMTIPHWACTAYLKWGCLLHSPHNLISHVISRIHATTLQQGSEPSRHLLKEDTALIVTEEIRREYGHLSQALGRHGVSTSKSDFTFNLRQITFIRHRVRAELLFSDFP